MNEVAAPRVSRGRAAVTVVVGLTIAGAVVGALWGWIAPPIHGVIALTKSGDRVHAALGAETDNFFNAAFLLVGFLVVLGVVAAVLVWQWRPHRGPLLCAALAVGSAAAAGTAAGVGWLIVRARYDVIDIGGAPISPEHRVVYVTEAPPVFFATSGWLIAASILFPVAMAALVYSMIAVSSSRDDLGGWPPEEPVLPPPVTVDGVLPSAR
jgi:F0F1-type ATP synthase assembly protein I